VGCGVTRRSRSARGLRGAGAPHSGGDTGAIRAYASRSCPGLVCAVQEQCGRRVGETVSLHRQYPPASVPHFFRSLSGSSALVHQFTILQRDQFVLYRASRSVAGKQEKILIVVALGCSTLASSPSSSSCLALDLLSCPPSSCMLYFRIKLPVPLVPFRSRRRCRA
jgi:hypothetical protein